jgi:hypothetical protein
MHKYTTIIIVADPHHLNADPDPAFHFDADPEFRTFSLMLMWILPVWRIRDVYPRSDFFPSRILKELKYFNPKKSKKMVSKL